MSLILAAESPEHLLRSYVWGDHQTCPRILASSLAVHFITAADVEQNDFLLCDKKREGNPVTVCEADGMAAGEFAARG